MQLWKDGQIKEPLCIIDIDQENFFGSIKWKGIRAAVIEELPWRGSCVGCKHRTPMRTHMKSGDTHKINRGTGQGDVDAPFEASLVQGRIAREARQKIYDCMKAAQAEGTGEHSRSTVKEIDELNKDCQAWSRQARATSVRHHDNGIRICHPGDRLISDSKMMDIWYLDDGTVLVHPALAVPFLEAFDKCSASYGAKRNRDKPRYHSSCQSQKAAVIDKHGAWTNWRNYQLSRRSQQRCQP